MLFHRLMMCLAFAAAVAAFLPACGTDRKRQARRPDRMIVRDTPPVLRDTIGAQATILGMEPMLVSGYGLVVGLNGTGSGDIPGAVRAIMEREMALLGVGGRGSIGPFGNITPSELLNDPNTAVVVVSAAVAPGAPAGTRFDVRIDALPGTATTSLEGGRLYTTRLYRGLIRPASPATESLAEAKGELFLNPFADPAKAGRDANIRTTGRVLNGGVITRPTKVTLVLDAPSHTRVRAMAEAINTRFPRGRGEEPVARGLNEEIIEINIPSRYRDEPAEFLDLLRRVRVDQAFPNEAAVRYARALREQPELSEELSWSLQALGPVAIPYIRDLYTHPEDRPRLAAVTAGAKLGDPTVRPALEELVLTGPAALRTGAVRLLGALGVDPKINLFLRDQLNSPDLEIRVAAYEALEKRRDPWISRRRIGDKFVLDLVPSAEPMVYVTLQREPKVVVFGEDLQVRRPVFASVWDDRLMVSSESETGPVRIFYRDFRTGRNSTGEVPSLLADVVEYLAHRTTPEEPAPGLDLTYSEVVGALEGLLRRGTAPAAFVTEVDRLELELIKVRQAVVGAERPELEGGERPVFDEAPEAPAPVEPVPEAERPETTPPPQQPGRRQYTVPLQPAPAPRPR